jgi:hypothetical protein
MAGRTERVNARDLIERADGIFFEGDVVRSWLDQLAKRTKGTLDAAKGNKYFESEFSGEYSELHDALMALTKACEQLDMFTASVAKREGKLVA